MKKIRILALTFSTLLILSACSLFGNTEKEENTKTSSTLPGIVQPDNKIDTSDNKITWSEISVSLPRTFPEITLNKSSNVNNITSKYNVTSVVWTNVTADNLKEVQTFLENELKISFEKDGNVVTAYDVTLSGTKYDISLSLTEGKPQMLNMNIIKK